MGILKEKGITDFGAVGFCYGGSPIPTENCCNLMICLLAPFVMTLAHENAIKAGVFTHPSPMEIPKVFDILLEKSNIPVLFNTCEDDRAFPVEVQAKADEMLGGGKYKPGYQRTYWKGCTHGFAVRGDMVEYLFSDLRHSLKPALPSDKPRHQSG